ncbi:hypothetical protein PIB30_035399 [Stylosanthes scabra]|uniref:Uncharacterized protein n=1 Tax=Stylosanthes scabra TaxID=79078 RepID=A0ABU6ZA32_9FABA|nr:hypothetical protein [Stylosanthes scabra]
MLAIYISWNMASTSSQCFLPSSPRINFVSQICLRSGSLFRSELRSGSILSYLHFEPPDKCGFCPKWGSFKRGANQRRSCTITLPLMVAICSPRWLWPIPTPAKIYLRKL